MKKFVLKAIIIILVTVIPMGLVNYTVDPSNIYHDDVTKAMADKLILGEIIKIPSGWNEGLKLEMVASALSKAPETLVIGSSHVKYIDFDFDGYFTAGLSVCNLGDYYSIIGLFEYTDNMPEKIIIGLDQWIFEEGASNVHHDSLSNYNEYARELILKNNSSAKLGPSSGRASTLEKIGELVSFSYFQASIEKYMEDGLVRKADLLETVSDDSPAEYQKALPNGRETLASEYEMTKAESIAKTKATISDGSNVALIASGVLEENAKAKEDFEALIAYLSDKGIEIEFYLAPWMEEVYEYCQNEKQFGGGIEIESYIRSFAKENGIIVRGSYNPEAIGITDDDFWDYQHLYQDKMLESFNTVL